MKLILYSLKVKLLLFIHLIVLLLFDSEIFLGMVYPAYTKNVLGRSVSS